MTPLLFAAAAAPAPFKLAPGTLTFLCTGMVIYVLIMLGIGFFASCKITDPEDYLVAGRRLPLWMATATLLATWFGAGSSLGISAMTYSGGIRSILADPFGASFCLLFAGLFVVGKLRKMKCLTVTDIIERQYGKGAGIFASVWMMPVYIGWLGSQMLGIGTLIHMLTGMEILYGTLIGAAVVLIYTYAGGMWAVTLTDIFQVMLIVAGLILLLPGTLREAGGFGDLYNSLTAADLSFAPPGTGAGDMTYYIGSWLVMGLGCMVGQDLIQRSLAAKNEKIAATSSVISAFLYFAIALIPVTVGFAARIVLPKYGITSATLGSDLDNQVLPQMAMIVLSKLHPVILVLFFSALFSAIMSSADSSLLAGTSLFCNNILKPFFPELSDRKFLLITRISTVVLIGVSLFFALSVENIYLLMKNSWVTQLVVVFIPVITALYLPKAKAGAAWGAMITALAVWLGYCLWACLGAKGTFVEIMNNFDRPVTCGAVYGFAAGAVVFFCCYLGSEISEHYKTRAKENGK